MNESSNGAGRWRVLGVSAAGTGHEKAGQECQDVHSWVVADGNVLIGAVADGAGTSSLGGVGAYVAAESSVRAIQSSFESGAGPDIHPNWRQLLRGAVKAAREAVESEAAARAVSSRELATTLIVVVATPSLVASAQVGDGAVVLRDETGALVSLTVPPANGYINETTFITSPDSLETTQFRSWKGTVAHIAAFSDGLQMLALQMPQGTPHEPFFAPIFQFASNVRDEEAAHLELSAFLRSPRITERTHDDVTLLIASLVD